MPRWKVDVSAFYWITGSLLSSIAELHKSHSWMAFSENNYFGICSRSFHKNSDLSFFIKLVYSDYVSGMLIIEQNTDNAANALLCLCQAIQY